MNPFALYWDDISQKVPCGQNVSYSLVIFFINFAAVNT